MKIIELWIEDISVKLKSEPRWPFPRRGEFIGAFPPEPNVVSFVMEAEKIPPGEWLQKLVFKWLGSSKPSKV